MAFLVHALVVLVVAGGLLLAAAGVTFLFARRTLHRRWRGVRDHMATRGALATWSLVAAWRERAGSRLTPEMLSKGSPTPTRRRMWVAIEDAEAAVRHADTVSAPLAELPAVCRSLRRIGGELDHLLRLERRLPQAHGRPEVVRAQVAEVIQASRDVQLAALQAAGDAQEPQLRALVRDAHDEVELVAASLRHLRSVYPQQP